MLHLPEQPRDFKCDNDMNDDDVIALKRTVVTKKQRKAHELQAVRRELTIWCRRVFIYSP